MGKLSSVSFFCPAYNDEDNLPVLIPNVHKLLSEIAEKFEIIIIEDRSPDKTGEMADTLAKKFSNTRVIHHKENRGYGGALKRGFQASKYDYIMYTDGDNQYDINEFKPYLHLLKNVDVLTAYVDEKAVSMQRKIQSIIYNFLVKILFFTNIKDINCSLKIYKKEVVKNMEIKCNSAFIDGEMLIKARRMGYKIKQFRATHYRRTAGAASGSKAYVVLETIKDMLKFRLGVL